MPIPVTIPRLGWNMDEGTFVAWLKADGDPVRPGDAVFSLEGEKATEEIESLEAGTLHIPAMSPKPGDRVKVGTLIGHLLQPGETPPQEERRDMTPPVPAETPAALRHIAHPDLNKPAIRSATTITPRARRLAAHLGIDFASLTGSGRNGRVRERDVAAAAHQSTQRISPLTPIRRAIAARMTKSRQTTAPVTLTSIVDATNLVKLRARLKAAGSEPTPSFTDFFVKLAAFALQKHPILASRWTDAGLVQPESINIGIAVDTDAGLLVPVVGDVPALDLPALAKRSRDLIERARSGTLAAADLSGGSFTVTNLGSFGIDAFTPIVNPPECAVLGIGRIERRPVMDGNRVVGREQVTLSLTFDHRIVDGAPAARFLQTLAKLVEIPGELLQ